MNGIGDQNLLVSFLKGSKMKTDTPVLISALRILARDIISEDGVANAAILEAADRLEELTTYKRGANTYKETDLKNDCPVKMAFGNKIWGTFIPNRRPNFKVYDNRGHALSSLMYRKETIYENGKWTDMSKIPDECTLWKFTNGAWKEIKFERLLKHRESMKVLDSE